MVGLNIPAARYSGHGWLSSSCCNSKMSASFFPFLLDQRFSRLLGMLRVTPENEPQTDSRLSHAVIQCGTVNIFMSSANANNTKDNFSCGMLAAP